MGYQLWFHSDSWKSHFSHATALHPVILAFSPVPPPSLINPALHYITRNTGIQGIFPAIVLYPKKDHTVSNSSFSYSNATSLFVQQNLLVLLIKPCAASAGGGCASLHPLTSLAQLHRPLLPARIPMCSCRRVGCAPITAFSSATALWLCDPMLPCPPSWQQPTEIENAPYLTSHQPTPMFSLKGMTQLHYLTDGPQC